MMNLKYEKQLQRQKHLKLDVLPSDQRAMMNDHFTKSLLALDQIKEAEKKKNILNEYSKAYYASS